MLREMEASAKTVPDTDPEMEGPGPSTPHSPLKRTTGYTPAAATRITPTTKHAAYTSTGHTRIHAEVVTRSPQQENSQDSEEEIDAGTSRSKSG